MQHNIVVAYQEGNPNKTKQLQHNLVISLAARVIAVRTVTIRNKGKHTPGTDNMASLKPAERLELAFELRNHRNKTPKPVRRVWISKDGSPIKPDYTNARPLGIPTIYDRAAQAL
jgi:RNA-directed DNA polymerase